MSKETPPSDNLHLESTTLRKDKRFFVIFPIILIFVLLVYFFSYPLQVPAGSTVLGQVLGFLCFATYFYLIYSSFFVKRNNLLEKQNDNRLPIHICLGMFLLLIVPLHSGFSFAFNVHSFSYYIIVFVVLTGIWGLISYIGISPEVMTYEKALKELINQIELLNTEIKQELLEKSSQMQILKNNLDHNFEYSFFKLFFGKTLNLLDTQLAASRVLDLEPQERNEAMKIVGKIAKKKELQKLMQDTVRRKAWRGIWLYCHVPAAIVGAVLILLHVFYVLKY